jgi:hypothetical protein
VETEGTEADVPMFTWSNEARPRLRSAEAVRLAEEQDAAARGAHVLGKHAPSRAFTQKRRAAAAVGLLVAGLTAVVLYQGQKLAPSVTDAEAPGSGRVAVGDGASTTQSNPTANSSRVAGLPMPEKPLPGQNKPPCKRAGEVELRGGCWHEVTRLKPPCKEEGKEDAYEWKGGCYAPSYPAGREPTSNPP